MSTPPAVILRRSVPNDHECLFTAVAYLCEGSRHNSAGQRLRKICSDAIRADPATFNEGILGKTTEEYAEWILNPFNWGGEIELGILSQHFDVELCVVSMEPLYLLPFPGSKAKHYLLYTGQHYDPLVGAASPETSVDDEVRAFPASDTSCDHLALACAQEQAVLAAQKASQRTVKKIKCDGCGAILDDAKAFQEHCGEVEHDDDFAYECSEIDVVESGDDPQPEGRIDLSDSENVATFYQTPNHSFATLSPHPIEVGGAVYPTAEHYVLVVQHTSGPIESPIASELDETVFKAISASTVDALPVTAGAFQSSERSDWFSGAPREAALLVAARAKFTQHSDLGAELKATGEKKVVLVDADQWAGMHAAGGIPTGHNHAGEALMAVRAELNNHQN